MVQVQRRTDLQHIFYRMSRRDAALGRVTFHRGRTGPMIFSFRRTQKIMCACLRLSYSVLRLRECVLFVNVLWRGFWRFAAISGNTWNNSLLIYCIGFCYTVSLLSTFIEWIYCYPHQLKICLLIQKLFVTALLALTCYLSFVDERGRSEIAHVASRRMYREIRILVCQINCDM